MPSYNLTIALGTSDDGEERRNTYEKSAWKEFGERRGALTQWAKKHLDKASGYTKKEK